MAEMSLADMRTFVRDHLESDVEELPNSLLDRFLYDGSNRIENFTRKWSFRAVEYTLPVVSGQQTYDLDTVASLISPAPLAFITDVRGENWTLKPQDHRAMRAVRPASITSQGTPTRWSQWGRTLYLWPTPSVTADYTILGYRQGLDWIASNSSPDFPEAFHELIAWWALNRAYAFLDDPELSAFYREEFGSELRGRAKHYVHATTAQPFVMGGGTTDVVRDNGLGPLRWPVMDI